VKRYGKCGFLCHNYPQRDLLLLLPPSSSSTSSNSSNSHTHLPQSSSSSNSHGAEIQRLKCTYLCDVIKTYHFPVFKKKEGKQNKDKMGKKWEKK
jgi:hypothetical protein